jgi:hypothetical protein
MPAESGGLDFGSSRVPLVEAEQETGHLGGQVAGSARDLLQLFRSGGGLCLRGLPPACVPLGSAVEPGRDEPVMAGCV